MRTIENLPGYQSYTIFEFDDDGNARVVGTTFTLADAQLLAAAKNMRDLLLDMDKQLDHALHLRDTDQLNRDYLIDLGSYKSAIDAILDLARMPE